MTDADIQPDTDSIDIVNESEVQPTVIIVATHNEHKIGEIARTLIPLLGKPVELRPTTGKPPKEDGSTFEENALIKARAAQKAAERQLAAAEQLREEAESRLRVDWRSTSRSASSGCRNSGRPRPTPGRPSRSGTC